MFLSTEGYKNLGRDFFEMTGKNYTRKQFKNKWDALKALYGAWIYYTEKATGLGWDPEKNMVTADAAQWVDLIKANKLIKGFRRMPLDNLELMEDIFVKAHVDGKSSVMPGVQRAQVPEEKELVHLDEEEEVLCTPSPMGPRIPPKHGAAIIASSPKNIKKSAVDKDFKRWVDHCISEDRSVTSTSNVTLASDIEAIMEQVVQCGASKGSDEYYIATKLFDKIENRCFFYAMKTSEEEVQLAKEAVRG